MTNEEKTQVYEAKIASLEKELSVAEDVIEQSRQISQKQLEEIVTLKESNEVLNESLDNANDRISILNLRTAIKDKQSVKTIEDKHDFKIGDVVTPIEKFEHLEVGYNAVINCVDGDNVTVSNKDNRTAHREPIVAPSKIFRIVAVLVMVIFSFTLSAQADSTSVTDTDVDSAVTAVIGFVFNILSGYGITLTPFKGIIMFLVMLIVRKIEKKYINNKTASDIRSVIADDLTDSKTTTMTNGHRGALYNIIHKLEGTKDVQQDTVKK